MKVLVVGSGGREHAIVTSISKSDKVSKIYCAPGNAGIAALAECVDIGVMDFDKLVAFAKDKAVDLVVVAPDDPLVAGAVDAFEAAGIRAFGPRANAAIIEGSKAFSKDLMKKYGIPTAAYENFTDADSALKYLETAAFPIVLKADGLALGKGVLICNDIEEAKAGVKEIMLDKHFGSAGNTMVIEEFMTGRGVIGSGDEWNNQLDRIALLRERYHTAVEDMESAAAAQLCLSYGVPFLGVRILSNSIVNGEKFDEAVGIDGQKFMLSLIDQMREYM